MKKALILVSIYSLVVTGYLLFRLSNKSTVQAQQSERAEKSEYPFLAKRIFVEDPNDMIINFVPLRQQLRDYVAASDFRIGVFFEYLPTGTSIGINEKEEFFRASLVKSPLIMKTIILS
mgnify:CR=1 FL=1